ncbi:MAG: bifunctional riboflavin kinase/FAD synthetase [Chloroflexota bacterium]
MQVEEELGLFLPPQDMVLTIGVFDGVHLGHQYLLAQLKEQALKEKLITGVVTFSQHPQKLLSPQTELPFLTNLTQRIALLKEQGVDAVIPLSFTPELARLSPRRFLALLKRYLRMRGLVIGPDFALGQGREGNIDTLHKLGQEMGFSVRVVPPVRIKGEVVSSTAIRQAIASGDMKRVLELTGRFFSLQGQVITGSSRGRDLGFPTANLKISPEQALPADGVYATRAYIGDKIYHSTTNIGSCPTFGGSECTVEIHIIDYNSDLYGQELKIAIIERLRGESKFDTAAALKKQIAQDIDITRSILNDEDSAK